MNQMQSKSVQYFEMKHAERDTAGQPHGTCVVAWYKDWENN
jgi:hypothetical protein